MKKAEFTTDVVTLSGTPGNWFVTVNDSSSGAVEEETYDSLEQKEDVMSELQDAYPFSRIIFKQAAEGCAYCAGNMAYAESVPVKGKDGMYYHYMVNRTLNDGDPLATCTNPKYNKYKAKQEKQGAEGIGGEDQPITSGMSDIDDGAPNFKEAGRGVWDEDERDDYRREGKEEAYESDPNAVSCMECGRRCGTRYPQTWDAPSEMTGEGENFQDDEGNWHCSQACLDKTNQGVQDMLQNEPEDADVEQARLSQALRLQHREAAMPDDYEPTGGREPDEHYRPVTEPSGRVYNIMVGDQFVMVAPDETYRVVPEEAKATRFDGEWGAEDAKEIAAEIKGSTMSGGNPVRVVPANKIGASMKDKNAGFSFAPSAIQGQVVEQFYPEMQHELIDYPNASNDPMPVELSGDPHVGQGQEGLDNHEELLPGAIEDAFNGMSRIGYVSTSPAGGAMGRDGKPQVLEGAPLRKENDIRGPMFTDEFYQNYDAVPGAAFASLREKVAGADEKKQFGLFLKKVMGEVAATFIAAFKVTTRMPMNQIPGVGEIQLAQVEQPVASTFNIVNTGSRVKYLMDKLTDSEIQDAINDAYAQGAVWHEAKEGGFVYEVFVRAETIDTESMILKYKFVTGTKEAE